jgi:DNA modification methylase
MKPVELFEYQIGNSTKAGDLVLDLFLGSGTSVIASEMTGRACYGAELDERYCDVIIKRWMKLTEKEAILESTGEAYDNVSRH